MATHKLQLTLDADGLRVVHRCTVEVAGHTVSHSEDIELSEASVAALAKGLSPIIESHKEEMEERTQTLALQHAAALADEKTPGVKRLRFEGTITPLGELK